MAPAGTRLLAGVQVDQGKATPFGRFLLSRIKSDDKDFQDFVTSTGFDPTRDVDEVLIASAAAGAGRKNGVVLVRGRFNTSSILATAKEKGATVEDYQGVALLSPPKSKAPQSGAVAFLSGTIAVRRRLGQCEGGDRTTRAGPRALDATIESKAGELSAAHHAWMVSIIPVSEMAGRVPDANFSGAHEGQCIPGHRTGERRRGLRRQRESLRRSRHALRQRTPRRSPTWFAFWPASRR